MREEDALKLLLDDVLTEEKVYTVSQTLWVVTDRHTYNGEDDVFRIYENKKRFIVVLRTEIARLIEVLEDIQKGGKTHD